MNQTIPIKKILRRASLPGGFRFWTTLLTLIFIGKSISSNFYNLQDFSISKYEFISLTFAFFLTCISILFNAFAWRSLLFWLGYNLEKVELINLYFTTNLLKYIPGGIWHLVQRFRTLRKYISQSKAITAVIIEPLLMVVAALLFIPFGGWQFGFACFCFLPALIFIPRFCEPILMILQASKAKQFMKSLPTVNSPILREKIISINKPYPLKPLLVEMLFVLFRFSGFWFCMKAFLINDLLSFGQWLACFAFAWTIGLIIPGAPGGLGVFESAVLLRIGNSVPEASLLAGLLCYRLVVTLADLAMLVPTFAKQK